MYDVKLIVQLVMTQCVTRTMDIPFVVSQVSLKEYHVDWNPHLSQNHSSYFPQTSSGITPWLPSHSLIPSRAGELADVREREREREIEG